MTGAFNLFRSVDENWLARCVTTGLASGEGLIWAVRDPVDRPGKDGERTLVDEGVWDKRLLVVEPELTQTLEVIERTKNTLSALMRLAWDSIPLQTLAKNAPATATDPHISILGHITLDELRRRLTEAAIANGLANRFLFIAARRSKLLPDGGSLTEADRPRLYINSARRSPTRRKGGSTGTARRDNSGTSSTLRSPRLGQGFTAH